MNKVVINGFFFNETKGVSLSNRSFKYGDSLFETIRLVDGAPVFLGNHYERLKQGVGKLKMGEVPFANITVLEELITKLAGENGITEGGVARLTVFRDSEGMYRPSSDSKVGYALEVNPYRDQQYHLNSEGLSLDIYDDIKKPINILSPFKTGSSLLNVMAGVYASEKELDDCFLLNEKKQVIEAISSNVFIVSNGVLYTPSVEDGCVGGTMRMSIINIALANNMKVYESAITTGNLLSADEILLTNAIKGVQWVSSFKQKRYFHTVASKLVTLLNAEIAGLKLKLTSD